MRQDRLTKTLRTCGLVVLVTTVALLQARAETTEPTQDLASRDLRALDGQKLTLKAPRGGVTVLVFYSTECPISNLYSSKLNELYEEFPRATVKLIGLCVDPDLTDAEISNHAEEFGLKYPIARDPRGELVAALGATVVPESFVLDDQGTLRYHGRIDDEFAARQVRNAHPQTRDLRDAITAILAGREVPQPHLPAVGCPVPEFPKTTAAPTYTKEIAAILQRSCQECHRPGQVGPFSLMTYDQACKRADDLASVAEGRLMPPWKPDPDFGVVEFQHDRSLSQGEIATLIAWAEAGAPEGNPADLPPPPQFSDDWALGTPDLVLETPEFAIPAVGPDIYRCFVLPTDLPGDVSISAIEYRPGNRKVVHHVLSYTDVQHAARKKDEAEEGPGYTCFSGPGVTIHGDLGGWAPGMEPNRLPEGIGRTLPQGADVVMQIHYHPTGKPETDRTRIGLYFSRSPIRQTYQWNYAVGVNRKVPGTESKTRDGGNPNLIIPPGEANHAAAGSWEVPVDVLAYAVTPHMHMIGKDMTMVAQLPNGRTLDLIKIPAWDFNWQNTYYFQEPIDLPKGTRVQVVAHFDNSDDNPRNPNHPPQEIRWGEATTDEMCIGFISLTRKGQDLTRGDRDDLREIFDSQRKDSRLSIGNDSRRQARGETNTQRD